jgi:hypothetical protein
MILAAGKESTSTVAKPGTYMATADYDGRASTPQAFKIN